MNQQNQGLRAYRIIGVYLGVHHTVEPWQGVVLAVSQTDAETAAAVQMARAIAPHDTEGKPIFQSCMDNCDIVRCLDMGPARASHPLPGDYRAADLLLTVPASQPVQRYGDARWSQLWADAEH